MRKLLKRRVVFTLFDLRWAHSSASTIATILNTKGKCTNAIQVGQYLVQLRKLGIVDTKQLSGIILYQVKDMWLNPNEVFRELRL